MSLGRDQFHLLHIRDAIVKVQQYVKGLTLADFEKKDIRFDAIVMQVMIIGESAKSLSEDFREKHAKMPWHQAVGLRNYIAHGYFDIKPAIVWKTIKEDLPKLKKQVDTLL